VDDEHAPAGEIEPRIGAVIANDAMGLAGECVQRERVAEVVAVNDVQRQTDARSRAQRIRADHVAAMNHGLGAGLRAGLHRACEQLGAVVAVRNDAELQAPRYFPRAAELA